MSLELISITLSIIICLVIFMASNNSNRIVLKAQFKETEKVNMGDGEK